MGERFSHSQRAREKQIIKAGMKSEIGLPSAWAAHRQQACVSTCYYCRTAKLHLFSRFWRILKMPASMRHSDKRDPANKRYQPSYLQRLYRHHLPFFRAKV